MWSLTSDVAVIPTLSLTTACSQQLSTSLQSHLPIRLCTISIIFTIASSMMPLKPDSSHLYPTSKRTWYDQCPEYAKLLHDLLHQSDVGNRRLGPAIPNYTPGSTITLDNVIAIFQHCESANEYFEPYVSTDQRVQLKAGSDIFHVAMWYAYREPFWKWLQMRPIPEIMPEDVRDEDLPSASDEGQ
jgi:hypothetical protein